MQLSEFVEQNRQAANITNATFNKLSPFTQSDNGVNKILDKTKYYSPSTEPMMETNNNNSAKNPTKLDLFKDRKKPTEVKSTQFHINLPNEKERAQLKEIYNLDKKYIKDKDCNPNCFQLYLMKTPVVANKHEPSSSLEEPLKNLAKDSKADKINFEINEPIKKTEENLILPPLLEKIDESCNENNHKVNLIDSKGKKLFKKQLIRMTTQTLNHDKLITTSTITPSIEFNGDIKSSKIEFEEKIKQNSSKKLDTLTKKQIVKNLKEKAEKIKNSKKSENGKFKKINKSPHSKDNDLDSYYYEKKDVNFLNEKIKGAKNINNAPNITELFAQEFFMPDYNFINTNQFIDISNLASRKNTNELFQHLLNSKLEADPIPVEKVPNNFNSPFEYLSIFKTLFLNEITARIGNVLKDLTRPSKQPYGLSSYRIRLLNDQKNTDFTYFEINDIKSENKGLKGGKEFESVERENIKKIDLLDTCFEIKYAKNFLVLITNFKEIKIDLLKDDNFVNKNYFLILGIIVNEKSKNSETQRIVTSIRKESFMKFFRNSKTEWLEIKILPLDKITTFIREYYAIQNLQYEEISKRIYSPKISLISNSEEHLSIMNKFFLRMQMQFNESQYQAIKEICSVKEGISLLQGPPGTGKTFTLIGIVSGLYHYIKNSASTYKRYIMICAPSNAAIDEIIIRIKKKGLIDENGNSTKPQLIRIGVLDQNPSEIVKNVSLEHLAQDILFNQEKLNKSKDQSTAVEIRQTLDKVSAKIEKLKKEMDDPNNKEIRKMLDYLFDKRRRLNFDFLQVKQNKLNYKEKYKQIVDNLLNNAEIICCTLSSAGSDKMDFFKNKIEALVVDEASQCTEPTNIIPFQLSINKVILIGDPKQLPATTFSTDSNKTLYNRSLFERFIDNGIVPIFLDEQYRMHEEIREFPSMMFYKNRLKDGEIIKSRKFPKYLSNFENKNTFFLDLSFSQEKTVDYSFSNEDEAWLGLKICKFIIKKNSNLTDQSFFSRIGFITPYKRQVMFFREIYKKEVNNKYNQIQINTVDSFQGQEKDIIIFSTVRSSKDIKERENLNIIGFLDDMRRMNVALTRAKFVLIIIGNGETLSSNEVWNKLLNHMITKGNYYKLDKPDDMDNFVEIMFRNTNEIPNIFRKTNLIYHMRTLKKTKVSENNSKSTLFEENFAKKKFKHKGITKKSDTNVTLIEDNKQEDEKNENWKYFEVEDILAHEDHSYLFTKNEKKSNLMCLISKNNLEVEEKPEKLDFNIFEIADGITKI